LSSLATNSLQLWINVIGYHHGMHLKGLQPSSNPNRPQVVWR
jgi:hypothetical protein